MGTAEVARILGVSRQRVHQLMRQPDFPAPTATLSSGHVWERAAIEAWLKESGRPDLNES